MLPATNLGTEKPCWHIKTMAATCTKWAAGSTFQTKGDKTTKYLTVASGVTCFWQGLGSSTRDKTALFSTTIKKVEKRFFVFYLTWSFLLFEPTFPRPRTHTRWNKLLVPAQFVCFFKEFVAKVITLTVYQFNFSAPDRIWKIKQNASLTNSIFFITYHTSLFSLLPSVLTLPHLSRFFYFSSSRIWSKQTIYFCLRPVSEADAEGLGTTIFPTAAKPL
jgi:hypothetical protein